MKKTVVVSVLAGVAMGAAVAIAQQAVVRRRQHQRPARLVEHHEIVARALHLGKGDLHACDYPRNIMP